MTIRATGTNPGGIAGITNGNVYNCYNAGNVTGTGRDAWDETFSGGIVGFANSGQIYNCYNRGTVRSTYNFAGGILGGIAYASTNWKYLSNCYNTGSVSAPDITGQIIADVSAYVRLTDCYFTTSGSYYGGQSNGWPSTTRVSRITTDNLKKYTKILGSSYSYDVYNQNSGYPVLSWQNNKTEMKLNKNQEYINVRRNFELKCSRNRRSNKSNWRQL